jgi:hypothetical protein
MAELLADLLKSLGDNPEPSGSLFSPCGWLSIGMMHQGLHDPNSDQAIGSDGP